MASAELIVAKTALSGALFRPDPRPCSRDDIESMFALVNSTITECSPPNVQRCKKWTLSNLVHSSARIAAFCKYLVALSKSFGGDKDAAALESKNGRVPSAKRRRLHILYLLNDILYHVKYRNRDDAFATKLEPALVPLVKSAASFKNCPKHIRKIHDLVGLWEDNGYFARSFIQQLRTAVEEGPSSGEDAKDGNEVDTSASALAKAAKTAPWVMPAMHGDPSTPWYDLPAANWLPVLEPNSTRPVNPSMIKPLVLAQGPADKTLVKAAKDLLADIDRIYGMEVDQDEDAANIGRLGERVEIDEITGEVIGGDTYYGWSRAFCEKMKRRKRNPNGRNDRDDSDMDRGRARSSRSYSRSASRSRSWRRGRSEESSRSRSRSRPAFKRQRISTSPQSRNRGRRRSGTPSDLSSRSRHRSPSYSRSRSRSGSRSRRRSPSRSRSRSRGYRRRSPSQNPDGKYRPRSPSFSPSGSNSRSWSRPRSPPSRTGTEAFQPPKNSFVPPNPPAPSTWNQQHPPPPMSFPIPPPLPHQQPPFNMPFPVPPPPPPNYNDQWPPAPPPPMHGQQSQHSFGPGSNAVPPPPFPGGWPVPPPSGPPGPPPGMPGGFHQQYHQQQGHYGQGQGQGQGQGGGYQGQGHGRGRGGYGRGGW